MMNEPGRTLTDEQMAALIKEVTATMNSMIRTRAEGDGLTPFEQGILGVEVSQGVNSYFGKKIIAITEDLAVPSNLDATVPSEGRQDAATDEGDADNDTDSDLYEEGREEGTAEEL